MNWGKCKVKNKYSNYNDAIYGRIVKVPFDFNMETDKLEEHKIIDQYGIITGRWTQQIYFND